jgi:HK97 gp10 family phage protein
MGRQNRWKDDVRRIMLGMDNMANTVGKLDAFALSGAYQMLEKVKEQCPVDSGFLRDSLYITATDKTKHHSPGTIGGLSKANPYCFITTNCYYAPFVEYGTKNMAAIPFMRPVFDEFGSQIGDAICALAGEALLSAFVQGVG